MLYAPWSNSFGHEPYRTKKHHTLCMMLRCFLLGAEREGFEPPEPLSSSVFKTAAFDHSATFPGAKVQQKF